MSTDQLDPSAPAGAADYRSASAMLRTWARETPDAPMLTEGTTTLTWSEVFDRATRVSRALALEGVSAGDRVAFLDRNSIEYFEVFFGCALLGAVSVAVNWRLAPAEMATIIDDARARVVFFGTDYTAAIKEVRRHGGLRQHMGPPRPVRRVARRRLPDPAVRPGIRAGPG